jgi:hypothetical protein
MGQSHEILLPEEFTIHELVLADLRFYAVQDVAVRAVPAKYQICLLG